MLKFLILLLSLIHSQCFGSVFYGYDVQFNNTLKVNCIENNLQSLRYYFIADTPINYTIELHTISNNQLDIKQDICYNHSCSYEYNKITIQYCSFVIKAVEPFRLSYIIDQVPYVVHHDVQPHQMSTVLIFPITLMVVLVIFIYCLIKNRHRKGDW